MYYYLKSYSLSVVFSQGSVKKNLINWRIFILLLLCVKVEIHILVTKH